MGTIRLTAAQALQAKEEGVTTPIEISVVPGTQCGGYESWWSVGVPEVSVNDKVVDAHLSMREKLRTVRWI